MNDLITFKTELNFAKGEDGKLPTFDLLAYTGGKMRPSNWDEEVVVDLKGIEFASQKVPVRFEHDKDKPVGHTESISITDTEMRASGVISRSGPWADDVVKAGKAGFPWQVSVGLTNAKGEMVAEGDKRIVNGQELVGPFFYAKTSKLKELSIVELGADENTVASIAAKQNDFIEKNVNQIGVNNMVDTNIDASNGAADELILAAKREEQRKDAIIATASKALDQGASVDAMEKLLKNALEDKSVKASSFERDVILLGRPESTTRRGSVEQDSNVIEAGLAIAAGVANLEKNYSEKDLNAADKAFKGKGLTLVETLEIFARRNGFSGSYRNTRELLECAFDRSAIRASGFSTLTLPGIFSNVANKSLKAGFMAVENSWEKIATVANARDFKQMTSYRLTGGMEFEKVPAAGEIPHGAVDEESYSNKVDTYGKMFAITRQDIINDDLGALTVVPQRIGRGGALKLNQIFWATLLDDAAFFTTGNKNYESGAGTVFGINGLSSLDTLFGNQVDKDGTPLGIMPKILLVPNALKLSAKQLINSTELRDPSSAIGTANPLAGAYEVVSSTYLTNAAAYYLFANPAELSAIEVAFLNGQRTPIVESADADFNTLGIQMRGYFDFGVAKQDFRAAAKSKGAA